MANCIIRVNGKARTQIESDNYQVFIRFVGVGKDLEIIKITYNEFYNEIKDAVASFDNKPEYKGVDLRVVTDPVSVKRVLGIPVEIFDSSKIYVYSNIAFKCKFNSLLFGKLTYICDKYRKYTTNNSEVTRAKKPEVKINMQCHHEFSQDLLDRTRDSLIKPAYADACSKVEALINTDSSYSNIESIQNHKATPISINIGDIPRIPTRNYANTDGISFKAMRVGAVMEEQKADIDAGEPDKMDIDLDISVEFKIEI